MLLLHTAKLDGLCGNTRSGSKLFRASISRVLPTVKKIYYNNGSVVDLRNLRVKTGSYVGRRMIEEQR